MDEITMHSTENNSRPLLVYDGDCGFCKYSVDYWQQLTGSSVEYQPYQNVYQRYPQISISEFQRAVQYITPAGEVASGAKASFLTISHNRYNTIWINLYRKLPGFSWLTESAYKVVSSHRNFFFFWSKLFWGKHPEPPTYDVLAWIFLRLFALTFLAAFYSFSTQAMGLIGSNGILPAAKFLSAVHDQYGTFSYYALPNVFWLNASDWMMQLVCRSGILMCVMLFFNIFPRFCLLGLYVTYLSVIYAGQVFMTFQWDMLLLETAVISFFMIRYRVLGIWLLRWLVFRYILASGLVKILSGDPAWWDNTALYYHFLTQPLPTPLAWYAYYLPHSVLRFGTAAALVIELVLPFLIFMPRRLRFIAGFSVLLMQISISLTGNYNFFNITSMVLCLSLFDDAALKWLLPRWMATWMRQPVAASPPWKITNIIAVVFTVTTVALSIMQFNLRFIGYAPVFSAAVTSVFTPFQFVNTYGPFAVMTKKRYEIIFEGSDDGVHWREYNFKYKPGDVYREPRWNIPFQPRLDWQLWFAALGPVQASPWLSGFVQRLLENSPQVLALMEANPFPDYPPVFVRALYYDYTYTTRAEYEETKAWWNRTLVGVYFPPVSLN